MNRRRGFELVRCGAQLVASLLACTVLAQQPATKQMPIVAPFRIDGVSYNNGGAWPFWQAGFFAITVDRLSSKDEMLELTKILDRGGAEALQKHLKKAQPIGHIGGNPVGIAQLIEQENGEKVLLLVSSERMCKINLHEKQFIFGAIQINISGGQKGTGAVAGSARVKISPEGELVVEAIGTPCVLLKEVTITTTKTG